MPYHYSQKVYDFFDKDIDSYFNYLSHTNQKDKAAEYISLKLKEEKKDDDFRILCIGGGTGEPEIKIFNEIKEYDFTIDYIDPSKTMMELFLKNIEDNGLKGKIGRTDNGKFEDEDYIPEKADLMLCINAIKFIDGWKETDREKNAIVKMHNYLKPGGKILIAIKSDDSPHKNLKNTAGGGKTSGTTIREKLKELDLVYYWENVSAHIDFSNCFVYGKFDPNEEGKRLISFIFRGEWDSFDTDMKEIIIGKIKEGLEENDGKLVYPSLYEYIWIVKNGEEKIESFGEDSLEKIELRDELQKQIRTIPNFPVKGVLFRDTTGVLRDPLLMKKIMKYVKGKYSEKGIKYIVAKDMQGLIWAGSIANELGVGIIPMFRKDLAGELITSNYAHEYNPERIINLQKDAVEAGDKVLIVDYIIATGATIRHMDALLKHAGADVTGVFSLMELKYLDCRKGLEHLDIETIVEY